MPRWIHGKNAGFRCDRRERDVPFLCSNLQSCRRQLEDDRFPHAVGERRDDAERAGVGHAQHEIRKFRRVISPS